ncbi:MAG TPA: PEGA domain-containing protein [Polyangiaceae bacterium]|nr:PEGA domain-containing protein [Polyangiaceae bacterium]
MPRAPALCLAAVLAGSALITSSESACAADGPAETGRSHLRVDVEGERGEIFIDGESVGHGRFNGDVRPGRHQLRVTREGHDTFEKELSLSDGEVHSESVALKPTVGEVTLEGGAALPSALDGIYGGVQLLAAFLPGGTGSTFQDSCDSIGASSCSAGSVTAGGISGYIGYMLDPIGVELALLGTGDFSGPSATFDGVKGSEINPVVAQPAREEKFTVAGFGGAAMLRARLITKFSRIRLNFALGPGLAYRAFVMRRDTTSQDGRNGFYSDVGTSYVSALLSFEASLAFELGGSTAISLGVTSWFEHAGDDTSTRPEERAVLTSNDGRPPIPQATPPYELANGSQWFLGPFLGLTFGP